MTTNEELFEHFRFEVDKGQTPMRIDKYMATHMEDTSRSRVQQAFKEGYVRVGDELVKPNYIVRPGDVIRFVMPYRRRGLEILPQDIPLNIVYEDEDVLVVNKPAGMVVHPGHGHFEGTLINALSHHLGISQGPEAEDERMGVLVHRIDKDTSGLLIVAKNDAAHRALAEQIKVHDFQRTYETIIHGHVKQENFTINAPIGRNPNDRKKMCVTPKNSKNAVTHIQLLEEFPGFSWLRCTLETGRTHQIRVHLAYIGHPVAGDPVYGPKKPAFDCGGQCLHAKTIGFVHPFTGRTLHFTAPLPEYFTQILSTLRAARDGKEAEP